MKLTSIPWICAFAAALLSVRGDDVGRQTPHQFTHTVNRTQQLGYLLALPKGYETESAKKWPLMLFLHGAGERGSDLSKVVIHGPPKLVKFDGKPIDKETVESRNKRQMATTKLDENFIVVSPQCPENDRWQADALIGLLDSVIAAHRVDTNRVYVTGLSMGGYGTWSLLTRFPERFAAAAPICGGGERIDVLLAGRKANAMKSLGVWAFHGGKDGVVPPEESERMVEALKKLGHADVKLTVYPDAEHDSWTETYNNPELYDWLLSHKR